MKSSKTIKTSLVNISVELDNLKDLINSLKEEEVPSDIYRCLEHADEFVGQAHEYITEAIDSDNI